MFRNLRIAVLLLLLIVVALGALTDRIYSTRWKAPLRVALYPVAADDSAETREYVAQFTAEHLQALEPFFAEEAKQYGIALDTPVHIVLAPSMHEIPPLPPTSNSALQTVTWSLHLRWWAWWTSRSWSLAGMRRAFRMAPSIAFRRACSSCWSRRL